MYSQIEVAMSKWVTRIFGWLIALVCANGALVHAGNILGYGEQPWSEFPPLWQVMYILLLAFNLVIIFGLVLQVPWTVFFLFGGMALLQWLPYTIFRRHFVVKPEDNATLNGLIGAEVLILAIYAGLIWWQGKQPHSATAIQTDR